MFKTPKDPVTMFVIVKFYDKVNRENNDSSCFFLKQPFLLLKSSSLTLKHFFY